MMKDLEKRERVLRERLAELDGRLHRIETHLEQKADPDWDDNATESEMDEVLEGLGQAGVTEMEAIHAALARIKGGSYGVCVSCGADISAERLDAVPHTALCKNCAAKTSKLN